MYTPDLLPAVNPAWVAQYSYHNYHVEGVDYVCLFRSKQLTLKAYLFTRDIEGPIVAPHTHRYAFDTRVLAGSLCHHRYVRDAVGVPGPWFEWEYRTILEGDLGFSLAVSDINLIETKETCPAGTHYFVTAHTDIHTLSNVEKGTILLLTQYADCAPSHTYAYTRTAEAPSTENLYVRMDTLTVTLILEKLQAHAFEPTYRNRLSGHSEP